MRRKTVKLWHEIYAFQTWRTRIFHGIVVFNLPCRQVHDPPSLGAQLLLWLGLAFAASCNDEPPRVDCRWAFSTLKVLWWLESLLKAHEYEFIKRKIPVKILCRTENFRLGFTSSFYNFSISFMRENYGILLSAFSRLAFPRRKKLAVALAYRKVPRNCSVGKRGIWKGLNFNYTLGTFENTLQQKPFWRIS